MGTTGRGVKHIISIIIIIRVCFAVREASMGFGHPFLDT